MASVNITINGVICDLHGRTITGPVKIVGEAMYSDVGVGGGPIFPSDPGSPPGIWGGGNVPMPSPPIANVPGAPGYNPPGGGGGSPPGIWGGGNVPMPSPPIANVPGAPGYIPPSIWPPGPGIDFPAHPIVIPPPVDPGNPIPPGTVIDWKPMWSPENGWQVVGIPNVPHPVPS